MAETFNLGKIALTPKGVFSTYTTYEKLDVVTYNGSSYIALRTTTGNIPVPNGSVYWQMIAEKGSTGDRGQAPTITLGTVTTLEPGQNVVITNTGTASDPIFNFSIPRGEQGLPGRPTITHTLTIAANQWNSSTKQATVLCDDMTSDALIIVTGNPDTYMEVMNAGIYCIAQGEGTLTFYCANNIPSSTVKENVLIFQ